MNPFPQDPYSASAAFCRMAGEAFGAQMRLVSDMTRSTVEVQAEVQVAALRMLQTAAEIWYRPPVSATPPERPKGTSAAIGKATPKPRKTAKPAKPASSAARKRTAAKPVSGSRTKARPAAAGPAASRPVTKPAKPAGPASEAAPVKTAKVKSAKTAKPAAPAVASEPAPRKAPASKPATGNPSGAAAPAKDGSTAPRPQRRHRTPSAPPTMPDGRTTGRKN